MVVTIGPRGRQCHGDEPGHRNRAPSRSGATTRIHCRIIERAHGIDDVVRNLDRIIDWATAAHSTIGYFAVLYKRSTLAIRDAIDRDLFQDSARMAEFDVMFAQRYFDALNAYFHPDEFPDLNLAWEVAFVGHDNPETTMLQQMLAGHERPYLL